MNHPGWNRLRFVSFLLQFMGFATLIDMKHFFGEDEGGDTTKEEIQSPGGIIIETLLNIRTVSALTLEEQRFNDYKDALARSEENVVKESAISGVLSGLSLLIQEWVNALLFWWGGWLVSLFFALLILIASLTQTSIDIITDLPLPYQVWLHRLFDCNVFPAVLIICYRSCNTRCVFLSINLNTMLYFLLI